VSQAWQNQLGFMMPTDLSAGSYDPLISSPQWGHSLVTPPPSPRQRRNHQRGDTGRPFPKR
jgi:hypothetical protein